MTSVSSVSITCVSLVRKSLLTLTWTQPKDVKCDIVVSFNVPFARAALVIFLTEKSSRSILPIPVATTCKNVPPVVQLNATELAPSVSPLRITSLIPPSRKLNGSPEVFAPVTVNMYLSSYVLFIKTAEILQYWYPTVEPIERSPDSL